MCKKGVLSRAICYLCGPMDRAKDNGTEWREYFIEQTTDLDLKIINPCDKPSNCAQEISKTGERKVDRLKRLRRWSDLKKFVNRFRHEDLRFVDIADFVVIYIDIDVHICGSYDEVFNAERQKKPCLAIVNGGLPNLPNWMFDVFNLHEVFDNVDKCVNYLKKIDRGDVKLDKRWVLIRRHLKELENPSSQTIENPS